MNNVIIGTAGHVDHGKTSLIKALTGIDTDRLKEEKKRGITIELGFAHLDFPDGRKVGIVDVPGHEKFVKNMLAGAGGIDICLLIVAANEGVMPQTKEHFEIIKLLNIKKGIIVITKTDMVDEDWICLVEEDIKAMAKGTSFENMPIMRASVYNNHGIEELKNALFELVLHASAKDLSNNFRIPVDRVFSVDGFGTVITGTLIEGMLKKGDSVFIYPAQIETKIRNIQVHDTNVEQAYAGQRVAVNLASIKKEDTQRGCVIAAPHSMYNTFMIDVKLQTLSHSGRVVKNNSRLHFYHGSRDVLCKVVLLDQDELQPGESGYAQLRLEEEVSLKYGDRYIVRFYSPMETMGGGMVLHPNPKKHSRMKPDIIESLSILENGKIHEKIAAFIGDKSAGYPSFESIITLSNVKEDEFLSSIKKLENQKKIVVLDKDIVISYGHYKHIMNKSNKVMEEYYKKNMFKKGMNTEEYKSRVLGNMPENITNFMLDKLIAEKFITAADGIVSKPGFKVRLDDSQSKLAGQIEKIYLDAGVMVPNRDDVLKLFKEQNKNKIMDSLIADKTLIMVDKQMLFHKKVFEETMNKLKKYIEENGEITLGQFRDLLGASRKYAVAILEYCDSKKITKKIGDTRILIAKQ